MWMRLLVLFTACVGSVTPLLQSLEQVPKYYVDPAIQAILVDERQKCMVTYPKNGNASALTELKIVRDLSATEYYRSHELFAHHFFVESQHNPHRVHKYDEAEFEYIPILPLYWASKQKDIDINSCSYRHLISSILKAQAYLVARDAKHAAGATLPKFAVASTFNLRTVLGTGMPTQIRRGEAWESVSNFVMSLSIGHYERWPQCPDLLRKSFKYVVELPYVMPRIASKPRMRNRDTVGTARRKMFFFSGNFELFGPEMVCSVRNEIINLASTRNDTIVVNSTTYDANTSLQTEKLSSLAQKSVFCLVTKSDSYSTSFFYLALSAGCIPVVISDWFVFAFPWLIPYEKFTLRIQENDFLQNPDYVLDYIASTIGSNEKLLTNMRNVMKSYAHLLSFDPVKFTANRFQFDQLPQGDVYLQGKVKVHSSTPISSKSNAVKENSSFMTYLPLELLLLELRYAQKPHQYYNNVPCLRPMVCARDHISNVSYTDTPIDYVFPAKTKVWTVERTYTDTTVLGDDNSKAVAVTHSAGYSVINDGYQVKAIFFPNLIDIRSHLCRHAMRLIGSYKIVYVMQCVRILWPLHPGTFKPVDNVIRYSSDYNVNTHKLTVARYKGGKYSVEPDGISRKDMQYVIDFHNATKPPGYRLVNYPVTYDRRSILPFNTIVSD